MAHDPTLRAHQEWIGYVQPVGLVVTAPALAAAQAYIDKNILAEHRAFVKLVGEKRVVSDLHELLHHVLGWDEGDFVSTSLPEVVLPEYGETLAPTHGVPEAGTWMMLIEELDEGTDLDTVAEEDDRRWQASPQAKFERLLRETDVPIGLLCNGAHLRLVYAPKGETSGYITFPVQAMSEVAGRPIFAAMLMLLSAHRLFALADSQRLPSILAESRKYQNVVSTRLSEQVLDALYELVRGFQTANEARNGALLKEVLRDDPNQVYGGLLTVLMRLVFVLYAEDRGLMPGDPVYVNHYSVTGLFDRLRADAGRYPDTMNQRYGAWAQLLTLFRLIHQGGGHGAMRLPARQGYLFDPDRYAFLEGRTGDGAADPPLVPDSVVFEVLQNLMILDGERLSYRNLDVEQIGSVYETMMGFDLEVTKGPSIAVKAAKSRGAPTVIDLAALAKVKPADRGRWIREHTDQSVTTEMLKGVHSAKKPEELVAALEKKVAHAATPGMVRAGTMILQPSDERRRSGSHYTPRSLTEPIVETALRPVLQQLGENPKPEQILSLKVCDPAMGSGAFLVEACRQLGDALVKAWHAHRCVPKTEDEVLHARRLVAQRCLYGVDRNPTAVDLAKLSLWLATLAKDHPFTFLDHALRHGDSLVGLSRDQIAAFHWKPEGEPELVRERIEGRLAEAAKLRARIHAAAGTGSHADLAAMLARADGLLDDSRLLGDAVVAAFFGGDTPKDREAARGKLRTAAHDWLAGGAGRDELRRATTRDRPLAPFHWAIEFPEVFSHGRGGFDAVVGNPPFAGKNTLINSHAPSYPDWLKEIHVESHGAADLVAHFFRRAFGLLRPQGFFGLIATKTIYQGDTRATGLRWLCTNGAIIYSARRRIKWPGEAAVVVSVVHICKGEISGPYDLDGRSVPIITAYLFHAGGHENPVVLKVNANRSFQGSIVLGMGFTFDDTDKKGVASPIAEMHRLVKKDPRNAERIFPYIGGEEVNDSPTHAHHRYVINFQQMSEAEAQRWPDLMKIVEENVKPERLAQKREVRKRYWWRFGEVAPALYAAIRGMKRVLVVSIVTKHLGFVFLPANLVYAHRLQVFVSDAFSFFAMMQSSAHELWARFFSSTLEDRINYSSTDCFETFPFPEGFETSAALEAAGKAYYEFRAALMVKNEKGLTKTYNRFHDPEETSPETLKLRELHAAMDRAVLDAYGWTDLKPACEFLLDYEEEEDDENGRGRKKPWRYRWPDDVRDEVLARLLELNRRRAEIELASASPGRATRKPKRQRSLQGESLFGT